MTLDNPIWVRQGRSNCLGKGKLNHLVSFDCKVRPQDDLFAPEEHVPVAADGPWCRRNRVVVRRPEDRPRRRLWPLQHRRGQVRKLFSVLMSKYTQYILNGTLKLNEETPSKRRKVSLTMDTDTAGNLTAVESYKSVLIVQFSLSHHAQVRPGGADCGLDQPRLQAKHLLQRGLDVVRVESTRHANHIRVSYYSSSGFECCFH